MPTPLGLAARLRSSFSEFVEVRIQRDGPGRLRAYCAVLGGARRVPSAQIVEWTAEHVGIGVELDIHQVDLMPQNLDDEEALLRRTAIPRSVAETATGTRVSELMMNLFPTEVVGLVTDTTQLKLELVLYDDVPQTREQALLDSTRLIMACDPVSLVVVRRPRQPGAVISPRRESQAAYDRLRDDRALLHESVATVLTGDNVLELPPLPTGSATYATVHDGVRSLLQRLALFERVYVYVPFSTEDFPLWAGASLDEFLNALPTGRIVPVFGQRLERYDVGLMTRVLESGAPRVILQGEHALRTARSFRADHPLIAELGSEVGTQIRSALSENTDDNSRRFLSYLTALEDVSADYPSIAVKGDSLATALQGFADWIDEIRMRFGHSSRALELSSAFEHRAVTEGIRGVPMTEVGHFFDSCVQFAYGAESGNSSIMRVPEPDLIGRICFPDTKGLSVREFAESFTGPRVAAMRELMSSTRVQSHDGSIDLVREFNQELKTFERRNKNEYAAIVTLMTVVGAFAIGLPIAVATLSLELARQMSGRKAPGAFATVASTLTRTTREAALLARVKNG